MENFEYDINIVFTILNGKVSMAIKRKLHRDFKKAGLEFTPEQWAILFCLWNKDGVTQQELCNATFKDKPSVTRLIDNLEKQNFVVRVAHSNDRRTNLIYLTKSGREMKTLANKTVLEMMREALQGVDIKDFNTARNVLNKVFENIKMSLT